MLNSKHTTHLVILLLVFLLLPNNQSFAQQNSQNREQDIDIGEIIENLAADSEDAPIDFDTHLEKLTDYLDRPLNINKATFEDLGDLGLLSTQQINDILDYRDAQGKFLAIYELQSVPSLDLQTIRRVSPFLKAKKLGDFNVPLGELLTKGKHQLFVRYRQVLEKQRGYQKLDTTYNILTEAGDTVKLSTDDTRLEVLRTGLDILENLDSNATFLELIDAFSFIDTIDSQPFSKYNGSPAQLYTRYRYQYGNKVSYGITAEKDAGEQFFTGAQKQGFDFYSAHFYIRDIGPFKHLALGDYEIHLGQGLIAWTGLGFRKSSDAMNLLRVGKPVRQYTSVNESAFFRGAAFTLGLGDFELTAFGSYKKMDGNFQDISGLDDDVLEGIEALDGIEGNFATSLQTSGLHRTESEIEDRNVLDELATGASLGYRSRRFSASLNAIYTNLSLPIQTDLVAYNLYRFNGRSLFNASLDYRFMYKNINFFGETAISDNGGIATLNGALVGLHPMVSAAILHRYYSPEYQSRYSNTFGERSNPQNEHGIYLGAVIMPKAPFKTWQINAYMDMYKHPWLLSSADAPSRGTDYLLQVRYRPSRRLEMTVRYRDEFKEQNLPNNDTPIDILSERRTGGLRFNLNYKIDKAKTLTLRSRAEVSWFNDGAQDATNEYGFMTLLDMIYKPRSSSLSFATRFAIFETPSYNTRIYAYENDVPFTFSVPAYYNRGTRYYVMMRYNITNNINAWIRFSQTYFANQETFGSGNEEIAGNVRSDIKAMVKFKF